MEKISVIIPIYNVEAFLPRCLDSILGGTYENLEVICVNDESPDSCGEILKSYSQKDERIKVVDKKNGGVSSARNLGLSLATGEYISFIDSDDFVHPEYFEVLMKALKAHNADISLCSYAKSFEGKEEINSASYLNTPIEILKINPLDPPHMFRSFIWGRLYKREILRGKAFNEKVSYMEDKDLSLSLICEKENLKVATVDAPLYYYFIREGSLSNNVNIEKTVASLYYLLNRADDYEKTIQKAVYINEALRYSFIILNRAKEQKDTKENILLAKRLTKDCVKKMKTVSAFSFKHRFVYSVFATFPFLHKLLRDIKISLSK